MSATYGNKMETQFQNLARVTRDWADGGRDARVPDGRPLEWLALERAMKRQGQVLARRRVLGGSALVVTAVAALMLLRGYGRSDPKLSFVVTTGTVSAGGAVRSDVNPARVSFSDGSDVVLNPGTRGTVMGTTTRGARVRLESGRARFAVVHRPQTDWSVEAGPFTVIVHGTVFDVGWSKQAGALAVDLLLGSVTIRGPVPGGAVTLRAGQRLTAHAATGATRVDSIPEPDRAVGRAGAASDLASPARADVPAVDATEAPAAALPVPVDSIAPVGRAAMSVPARSSRRLSASATLAGISEAWMSRVASGGFQSVVDEAEAFGVERCLGQVSAASLEALADAARYVRRTDLARRALLAERRRFAGTLGAHDAAFLIGRLAEDTSGDSREALAWYDRYLGEGERGTYAAEALGRKMMALDRLGEDDAALTAAARYLAMYPGGAFAGRARRIQREE